jgi:hypothetical protein
MDIKDNTFARQFETTIGEELISVEIFKKKHFNQDKTPESFEDETFYRLILKAIA